MRFIAAIYPATGLRPSELRLARIDDLNLKDMTIRVRHPKGEGSYGEKRIVSIMPQAEEATREFIVERREYLQVKGIKESKYLIPNLMAEKDAPYSSNHLRKLKKELQDATGIEFKLKDFRSTFASLTVKKDPNLRNLVKIIIAKQRNGPIGDFDLYWKKELTKYENLADSQYSQEE